MIDPAESGADRAELVQGTIWTRPRGYEGALLVSGRMIKNPLACYFHEYVQSRRQPAPEMRSEAQNLDAQNLCIITLRLLFSEWVDCDIWVWGGLGGWLTVGEKSDQGSSFTLGGGGARIFIYGGWTCVGADTICDTYGTVDDAWEL